jgi:hypothetical protein
MKYNICAKINHWSNKEYKVKAMIYVGPKISFLQEKYEPNHDWFFNLSSMNC